MLTLKNADEISLVLRCMVEEFGGRNVYVSVPASWESSGGPRSLGEVKLHYANVDNFVTVSVLHEGSVFDIRMCWNGRME